MSKKKTSPAQHEDLQTIFDRKQGNTPHYMNEKSASDFCNLSEKTLQRYRVHGGGPTYIKCGARILYNRDDIISWLESKKVSSTSEYGAGQ